MDPGNDPAVAGDFKSVFFRQCHNGTVDGIDFTLPPPEKILQHGGTPLCRGPGDVKHMKKHFFFRSGPDPFGPGNGQSLPDQEGSFPAQSPVFRNFPVFHFIKHRQRIKRQIHKKFFPECLADIGDRFSGDPALPEKFQKLLNYNPMVWFIELNRGVVFSGCDKVDYSLPSFSQWAISYALGTAAFILGFIWFNKTKRGFSDVL